MIALLVLTDKKGFVHAFQICLLCFSHNEDYSCVPNEDQSAYKHSHPFRNSFLVPLQATLPLEETYSLRPLHSPSPIRRTRRELHSRVYHCPDNNDLPTRELLRVRGCASRGVAQRERRDEVSRMAGPPKKARRAATLHSGVFHFNGPPGDWLTPSGDPPPFRHNGPLHYLFVLANVLLAAPLPTTTDEDEVARVPRPAIPARD